MEVKNIWSVGNDDHLSKTATFRHSILGIGPVASSVLIIEMPEKGNTAGEEPAVNMGLAPAALDIGAFSRRAPHLVACNACGIRRGSSQHNYAVLCRSSSQSRHAPNSQHHRHLQKVDHHREL